jgi:RNA polymerase sigma factor (sigma-70 family)
MITELNAQMDRALFDPTLHTQIGSWSSARLPKPHARVEPSKSRAERALLENAKSGDTAAFGELAQRCRAPLMRTARTILRDEADSEDSVQDSLLNAFANLRNFDGRSTFLTWATRITINCCLMKLRSRRRHYERRVDSQIMEQVSTRLASPTLNPEQVVMRDVEQRQLKLAIAALPAKLRSVIEIKELQGRSAPEAASLLKISVPATKARMFRAKGLLKRSLSSKFQRQLSSSADIVACRQPPFTSTPAAPAK